MHILVLLFTLSQAFAAVETVIGTIDSNARSVAFRTASTEPQLYFLYSPNNGVNTTIRHMRAGESFRLIVKDPFEKGDVQVLAFKKIDLPFYNVDVEEPNPADWQTLPNFSLNDPRLGKRAIVYRHLLEDDAWRFKFLDKGGSREFIKTMRRYVLADTLYTMYPDYPRTLTESARDNFFDTAVEVWGSSPGDDTLYLIQTMLYESLDSPTQYTSAEPAAVAAHSRAKLDVCDTLIRALEITSVHETDAARLQLRLEGQISQMMNVYRPKVH